MKNKMILNTNRIFRYQVILSVFVVLFLLAHNSFSWAQDSGSISVEGKPLRLLGTGLREFLIFDIYKMSAYSESGECKVAAIVHKDEAKALRLVMERSIPKERLVSNLRSTFMKNMPKDDDVTKMLNTIDEFLSYFRTDLSKKTDIVIVYSPGSGTTVKQNGKVLGPSIVGKDFSELLWKSYFGENTCCSSLKSEIIEQCNKTR